MENVKRAFFFILAGDFRLIFRVLKIRVPFSGKDKRIKNTDIAKWIANNINEQPEAGPAAHTEAGAAAYTGVVDIVVPVYNGIEFFDALFKSLPRTNIDYNLYIIDDCSPDERVAEYLRNMASEDKRVRIITNEANLGFVQSVNKGFSYTTNHVALLNTDIELPPQWLERLMYPVIHLDNIASSTPFSNSGTLNSFPRIGEDNPLFKSLSCEEIDSAFLRVKPSYTEVPTGVGFCMGINKNALDRIGAFDAETFTRGFGEENDWCQRAKKAGYKNVMVENLFVYHKHGGSFSGREKEELIKRNNKLLSKKHPRYNADVTAFFGKDPLKLTRGFMEMYLLCRYNVRKQLIVFDHSLAGGATIYLDGLIKRNINDGNGVIVVRYDSKQLMFLLEFWCKDHKLDFNIGKIEDIRLVLKQVRCDEIIVNELATFNKPYELMGLITELQKELDTRLIMYVHDYYCICPTVTLIDFRRLYCHLPGADVCRKCFSRLDFASDYESIETWRRHWGGFLNECDEVIVFSNDSKNILENIYGALTNLVVIPHKVDYITNPGKKNKTTNHINIGLIGFLNYHKGLGIIREMLKIIKKRKLNVRIILIGSSHKVLRHKYYRETGTYTKESLPLLTMQNDIDVFFIASIWPETFSYTTEEAIKMDMPVAAFNLGAPAERVSTYNKGILIDTIDAEAALDKIVSYYIKDSEPVIQDSRETKKMPDRIKSILKSIPGFMLLWKTLVYWKYYGTRGVINKLKYRIYKEGIIKGSTLGCFPTKRELKKQKRLSHTYKTKFSIVVPLYNTPPKYLTEMIESVQAQSYPNWELCLADGSDLKPGETEAICRDYIKRDARIKYTKLEKNLGISENTNKAINMATGDYIALLDHDDILWPNALYENARAIKQTSAEVLYSDEDHIDADSLNHSYLFLKPDWSRDLLYSQNYICHFLVFKATLLNNAGLFDPAYDGSQDYDLVLRLSEYTERIYHIPKILYSWRETPLSTSVNLESKPRAQGAGLSALNAHLDRRYKGMAKAGDTELQLVRDTRFHTMDDTPLVSIIIPMRDKAHLADQCIQSIIDKSSYKNREIIIIDNRSEEKETFEWFDRISGQEPQVCVVKADIEFNWSKINNLGMSKANGSVFIFLNNDTLVITPDWIERLCENALRDDIGAVGPLLLYEDDMIQHAGAVVGMGGFADHVYKGMPTIHVNTPYISPMVNRNVLAVTGACLCISRKTIEEIGTFNEAFIICGSDVELGIRAYEKGLRNLYNANVRLYHLESKSRDSYIPKTDFKLSRVYYKPYRENIDPYYNPNLDIYFSNPIVTAGGNVRVNPYINYQKRSGTRRQHEN